MMRSSEFWRVLRLARAWGERCLAFGSLASAPDLVAEPELLEPAIPAAAVEGASTDRLLAWMLAALEESRQRDASGEMWRGRAEFMFRAALAAWRSDAPERPAAGFCAWVASADNLGSWLAGRSGSKEEAAETSVRTYLSALPGYAFGQPAPGKVAEMHGYLTMQLSAGEAVARYIERACDDPGAVRALALAGFEPLVRPSEDRAFEGLSLLERRELERSIELAPMKAGKGAAWI